MIRIGLIVLLWGCFSTSMVSAQAFARVANPKVPVTITHPSELGLTINKVAIGAFSGNCARPFIDRIMAAFIQRGVAVIDYPSMQGKLMANHYLPSHYMDQQSAAEMARILGPVTVLMISAQCSFEPRLLYENRRGTDGRLYRVNIAQLDGFLQFSVRVMDLETARIFKLKTFQVKRRARQTSVGGKPPFPSQQMILEDLLTVTLPRIERLFFPWQETRKLYFFNNKACNLKSAYKLLKHGDLQGAAALSKENWKHCQNADVKPYVRARATYNLGMAYFFYGDYENALKFFVEANRIKPGDIIAETIAQGRKALQSQNQMREKEEESQVDAPTVTAVQTIHEAVKAGDWAQIETMLQKDPSQINAREKYWGFTPVHLAVLSGNKEIVEKLIWRGADLRAKTFLNRTVLHLIRNPALAEILIEGQSDPNLRDDEGKTPLHMAVTSGSKALVTMLLAAGADPALRDSHDRTAMDYAKLKGAAELVLLFEKGAEIR